MPDCRRILYRYPEIYDHRAVSRLFLRAVRENVQLHRDHNRAYRRMLGTVGFSPESLRTIGDLQHIPPVPTTSLLTCQGLTPLLQALCP